MKTIKIAIGSDHAGFDYKSQLIGYLKSKNFIVSDKGCYSDERADYPDYAHAVAREILAKEADFGILLCGSGNGINISANKHQGIRSALCWKPEIADMARKHNDANILTLPARYVSLDEAFQCVDAFFSAEFEGGRHADRIKKIDVC
jgi:ribose 5-phosphate isomerase B